MASKLEKARHASARLRQKIKTAEPLRAASAMGGGAAVGALERSGVMPTSVLSLPTKPLIAGALYLVGATSAVGGTWGTIALGAGDGILGAYGYAAAKAGTLIAGDDDSDEDIDI